MTAAIAEGGEQALVDAVESDQDRRSAIRARLIRYRIQELGGALLEHDRIKLALQLLEGTDLVVLPGRALLRLGEVGV